MVLICINYFTFWGSFFEDRGTFQTVCHHFRVAGTRTLKLPPFVGQYQGIVASISHLFSVPTSQGRKITRQAWQPINSSSLATACASANDKSSSPSISSASRSLRDWFQHARSHFTVQQQVGICLQYILCNRFYTDILLRIHLPNLPLAQHSSEHPHLLARILGLSFGKFLPSELGVISKDKFNLFLNRKCGLNMVKQCSMLYGSETNYYNILHVLKLL